MIPPQPARPPLPPAALLTFVLLAATVAVPGRAQPVESPPAAPTAPAAQPAPPAAQPPALAPAEANAAANREYVAVAQSLKKLVLQNGDAMDKLQAYVATLSRVEAIADQYPSSDLAVHIVNGTDPLCNRIEALIRQQGGQVNNPFPNAGGNANANFNPAGNPPAPSPAGPPAVNDGGHFFSDAAVRAADDSVAQARAATGKGLTVETFAEIPPDARGSYDEARKAQFFSAWAERRAKEAHVNGLYVLICRAPTYLEVVSNEDGPRRFTPDQRDRVRNVVLEQLKAKKDDAALFGAVKVYRDAIGNAPTP